MVKCFKLLEIQGSTMFEGFLPGTLLVQISVVIPCKFSIFTKAKLVKRTWEKSQTAGYPHFKG